jgi:hypothetical protein
MTDRPKFVERKIIIDGFERHRLAGEAVRNMPIYFDEPLEVVIREQKNKRTLEMNAKWRHRQVWHQVGRQGSYWSAVESIDG